MARWVYFALVLCLLALTSPCLSDVFFTHNGQEEVLESAQLWYEGRWKEIDTVQGTAVFWPGQEDVRGKIALVNRPTAPHETRLRDLQRQGALAVVILRKIGSHHPGFSMYIIDGSDRSDISIPVVEASYGGPKGDSILSLPNNSPVTITYRENLHKRAADTKFQVILNAILSSWEFVIIILGTYRVYQFWFIQEFTWKATAPFCCVLEVIGAMFRFGYTLVDPFYAYRMIPDEVTISMITVSFPFALSSGILLTFFWAESLSRSNVRAVPFISRYRTAAIVVVVCLFIIEIITSSLRATLSSNQLHISPNYISVAVYLVIVVVLVTCYLSTSIAIGNRIGALPGKGRRRSIRIMTLRVAISTAGYVIMFVALICQATMAERVWARQLTLNGMFVGVNWASLMQVIALRPIGSQSATTSSTGKHSGSTGVTRSERGEEDNFPETAGDEETSTSEGTL